MVQSETGVLHGESDEGAHCFFPNVPSPPGRPDEESGATSMPSTPSAPLVYFVIARVPVFAAAETSRHRDVETSHQSQLTPRRLSARLLYPDRCQSRPPLPHPRRSPSCLGLFSSPLSSDRPCCCRAVGSSAFVHPAAGLSCDSANICTIPPSPAD